MSLPVTIQIFVKIRSSHTIILHQINVVKEDDIIEPKTFNRGDAFAVLFCIAEL